MTSATSPTWCSPQVLASSSRIAAAGRSARSRCVPTRTATSKCSSRMQRTRSSRSMRSVPPTAPSWANPKETSMAAAGLIVLNAPDNAHRPPNTGDGSEFGDNWQAHVNSLNTMFAALFGGTGVANTIIAAGATKALAAADSGKTIALDTAAGSVVTLPTATGSGNRFKFFVKTLATSNSHIIYCHDANGGAGADNFIGLLPGARVDSTNALLAFAAA